MKSKSMWSVMLLATVAGGALAQKDGAKPPIRQSKVAPVTTTPVHKVTFQGVPDLFLEVGTAGRGATDAELKAAPNVEAFIDRLPEWGRIYPQIKDHKGHGEPKPAKPIKGDDGKQYDVTKMHYSITTTPEEIVAFQPINGFWLGSVIQEKGLVEGIGSFTEVPIEAVKRPRLKITTDLLIPDNVETVNDPSSSSINQAVSKLITKAMKAKVKTGSSISYKMTDSFTDEQTALSLGLDAYYMGASVKASLSSTNTATRHSVSAVFIEKAFTVKADFEGRSGAAAFFNNKFTMDDARKLVNQGTVSVNNMPAYLASITYGRMLVFTLTADASSSDIQGAIQASYDAVIGGASVSAKNSDLLKKSTTTITVTSVGGPTEAASGLIKSGELASFFSKSAPLTSMVPISYTVNTVRENRLASMARTTDYTATTYNANNTFFKYNVTMYWQIVDSDDGVLDNTVECYGELRINGVKRWSIPRELSDSFSRESGQTIEIGDGDYGGTSTGAAKAFSLTSDSAHPTPYQLGGFLYDSDGGSADDVLVAFNSLSISLEKLAGKGQLTLGNGAARLIVRVDRAGN